MRSIQKLGAVGPKAFIKLSSFIRKIKNITKVAGERKSDSQLTIGSVLTDFFQDCDLVFVDKGFPAFKFIISDSSNKIMLVMAPFLEANPKFTKEESERTYSIARVRIHVERIMQWLRTYQILNKIQENLFSSIDDIIHVCCVLVNLQPPIISNNE